MKWVMLNKMYEGDWVNDRMDGQGALSTLEQIYIYKGTWREGRRHGLGDKFFSDGSRYEGNWLEDQQEGQGTLYYPTGEKHYEGGWHSGQRFGRGTQWYTDGSRYE